MQDSEVFLSLAAANAGQPEGNRYDPEGSSEPDDQQHIGTRSNLDVIGFKSGMEDACQRTVYGCGSRGGCDSKDGRRLRAITTG
jgi:hypothetical protein